MRLGSRLRQLRHERGLSLDKLAELTGVSKPMLGQVERGTSSPTVATLWKIATGLQVPFTALLQDASSAQQIRARDQTVLFEDGKRFQVYSTYSAPGSPVELFRVVLLPGCKRQAEGHGQGVMESITVYQGNLIVTLGDEGFDLVPGDALNFVADVPHTYENRGATPCTVHMAIFYPGMSLGAGGAAPLQRP
ncbi:helix-turn-helix domain-containing protein [Alicyclobacillus sp. ALC3]|uniref:helix-turn-helix domain-containing protein n=1 Tax=Alicyclobacillus sp. ALC3 TaxID=2796143 RepID=UPI0023797F6A|nr:XRE family transcriptional regulator [Alicyclobacillus sp. ALC3]WDL95595.1 helix-turn-helix transcriptional regulator [Alicyclobacillus sp. ALC3]